MERWKNLHPTCLKHVSPSLCHRRSLKYRVKQYCVFLHLSYTFMVALFSFQVLSQARQEDRRARDKNKLGCFADTVVAVMISCADVYSKPLNEFVIGCVICGFPPTKSGAVEVGTITRFWYVLFLVCHFLTPYSYLNYLSPAQCGNRGLR